MGFDWWCRLTGLWTLCWLGLWVVAAGFPAEFGFRGFLCGFGIVYSRLRSLVVVLFICVGGWCGLPVAGCVDFVPSGCKVGWFNCVGCLVVIAVVLGFGAYAISGFCWLFVVAVWVLFFWLLGFRWF